MWHEKDPTSVWLEGIDAKFDIEFATEIPFASQLLENQSRTDFYGRKCQLLQRSIPTLGRMANHTYEIPAINKKRKGRHLNERLNPLL